MLHRQPQRRSHDDSAVIRILIADDHQIVRAGLARFIGDQPDMRIVAEAASGDDVLRLVDTTALDVVLLDIGMPDRSGIDCLHVIHRTHPELAVLMLSAYPESHYAVNTLRAGASGYVSKLASPDEIVRAIRLASRGKKYVSDTTAGFFAAEIARNSPEPAHETLSAREFQVFLKLAQGHSATSIADDLCVSVKTISTYRTRLLLKMGLTTNADLTQYALRHALIE